MIEALQAQLAILRKAQTSMGQQAAAAIEDSVKRHLRILAQKPEIGRLALSIATLEAAIADAKAAAADPKQLPEAELPKAVELLQAAADARPEEESPTPPETAQPQEKTS